MVTCKGGGRGGGGSKGLCFKHPCKRRLLSHRIRSWPRQPHYVEVCTGWDDQGQSSKTKKLELR